MFWFQKFVAALILPPTAPLLVALLGLAIMRRAPRSGRFLACFGVGMLFLFSVPVVANTLGWLVAEGRALAATQGRTAQAIVVLGGGIRENAPEYGGDSPSVLSLERARYGAFLARERGLPVAASGGVVRGGRPEAEVIAELMSREFGVDVRWVERTSRNTHENAVELGKLLLPEGITRVLLVTHAVHARRSRREMSAAGFEVTLAPTVFPDPGVDSIWDLVPSAGALSGSYLATHEMLGNLKATLDGLP